MNDSPSGVCSRPVSATAAKPRNSWAKAIYGSVQQRVKDERQFRRRTTDTGRRKGAKFTKRIARQQFSSTNMSARAVPSDPSICFTPQKYGSSANANSVRSSWRHRPDAHRSAVVLSNLNRHRPRVHRSALRPRSCPALPALRLVATVYPPLRQYGAVSAGIPQCFRIVFAVGTHTRVPPPRCGVHISAPPPDCDRIHLETSRLGLRQINSPNSRDQREHSLRGTGR